MYAVDNQRLWRARLHPQEPRRRRGEETWFTILTVKEYVKGVPSILDAIPRRSRRSDSRRHRLGHRRPRTRRTASSDAPAARITPIASPPIPAITSKLDGRNSWGWRRQSLLERKRSDRTKTTRRWSIARYAGNFIPNSFDQCQQNNLRGQDAFRMRVLHARSQPEPDLRRAAHARLSKIRKSSEVAMIFDGFECHNYNTNNISLRHSRKGVQLPLRRRSCTVDQRAQRMTARSIPMASRMATPAPTATSAARDFGQLPFPWSLDQ